MYWELVEHRFYLVIHVLVSLLVQYVTSQNGRKYAKWIYGYYKVGRRTEGKPRA